MGRADVSGSFMNARVVSHCARRLAIRNVVTSPDERAADAGQDGSKERKPGTAARRTRAIQRPAIGRHCREPLLRIAPASRSLFIVDPLVIQHVAKHLGQFRRNVEQFQTERTRGAMKLVSFRIDGRAGYGVVEGTTIADVTSVLAPDFPDLRSILGQEDSLSRLRQAAGQGRTLPLDGVELLPPVPNPA